MADPLFTKQIRFVSLAEVTNFFESPAALLVDTMEGLDVHARAALGLIFRNSGWLPSPIAADNKDLDLLDRLGSNLGGVTTALSALDGSLVHSIIRDGRRGWVFAHPTMLDAYGQLLQQPELAHHFVASFPIDKLLNQVSCGDVDIEGATIIGEELYPAVLERLALETKAYENVAFASYRGDAKFMHQWVTRFPDMLENLRSAGLMLDADENNELAMRLHELHVLPEDIRRDFAKSLIEHAAQAIDLSSLWRDEFQAMLTPEERIELLARVREDVLGTPWSAVRNHVDGWSSGQDPEQALEQLEEFVDKAKDLYPSDPDLEMDLATLRGAMAEWIEEHPASEKPKWQYTPVAKAMTEPLGTRADTGRSTFDDLLVGRNEGGEDVLPPE